MVSDAGALQQHFDDWLARSPEPGTRLRARFGTHALEIKFHDEQFAVIYGRALQHAVPGTDSATALTLHIISGSRSDLALPRLAWTKADFGLKRLVPGWSDDRRTIFLLRTEAGLALVNWEERRGYVWVPGCHAVPWWERAAPFRWLLDRLAQRLGLCTLHAGVISRDGRGVLFAGPGGTGKSTLALGCLGLGLDYLADDYCLFAASPGPTCFNLYGSAKWSEDASVTPAWLGDVPARALDRHGEKSILFLDECDGGRIASDTALTAIVLPRIVANGPSRLSPATPQEALRQLAPSTIAQSEADGGYLASRIARLVKTVPAFHLDMPPRAEESAMMIADLLDSAPARTAAALA